MAGYIVYIIKIDKHVADYFTPRCVLKSNVANYVKTNVFFHSESL